MIYNKYRYFHDTINDTYHIEHVQWIPADANDPRAASLGMWNPNNEDYWLPITMCGMGCMMTELDHTYVSTETFLHTDDDGIVTKRNKPTGVISFVKLDIYNKPLKMGYVEISEEDYITANS